mmetsp:Transcript_30393/g.26925  ORF Transcript_30393/g.26925 Transcript_30393/m.26925 type:complete len:188 (-) Transcript_30393:698-1261(-)
MHRGMSAYKARNNNKISAVEIEMKNKYKLLFSTSAERNQGLSTKNIEMNKTADIQLGKRDLRQIMYEANALLKVANDELININQKGARGSNEEELIEETYKIDVIGNTSKNIIENTSKNVLTNTAIIKAESTSTLGKNDTKNLLFSKPKRGKSERYRAKIRDFVKINVMNLSKVSNINKRRFGVEDF